MRKQPTHVGEGYCDLLVAVVEKLGNDEAVEQLPGLYNIGRNLNIGDGRQN